jgi:hypothetical protein
VILMKKIGTVAAILWILFFLGGSFPSADVNISVTAAAPSLSDLQGVAELRSLFNKDAGKVRLVLLLSPT